jgi:hypothetical protein
MNREQIARTFVGLAAAPRMTKDRLARQMANHYCSNPAVRAQVARDVLAVMESAVESGAHDFEHLGNAVADWFIEWAAES